MNWVINCLLPLGYTVFMMDRHGSYRALCDLLGGRHTRFERSDPVCVGPFDGDLSPEHQDALLVTMAEMCTRVSTAIPQASTTLTSRQGLILARLLNQWVERGELDSVPRLGQFVTYLNDHPLADDRQVCQELATFLSPYCLDGPYAAFIDGPSEIRLGEGLWSFDMAALANTGQLSVVLTTSLLSAIDRFVTDPATFDIPILVGMDEVSFDLKTPQAVEMIDRFTRALCPVSGRTVAADAKHGRFQRRYRRHHPQQFRRVLDLSAQSRRSVQICRPDDAGRPPHQIAHCPAAAP